MFVLITSEVADYCMENHRVTLACLDTRVPEEAPVDASANKKTIYQLLSKLAYKIHRFHTNAQLPANKILPKYYCQVHYFYEDKYISYIDCYVLDMIIWMRAMLMWTICTSSIGDNDILNLPLHCQH